VKKEMTPEAEAAESKKQAAWLPAGRTTLPIWIAHVRARFAVRDPTHTDRFGQRTGWTRWRCPKSLMKSSWKIKKKSIQMNALLVRSAGRFQQETPQMHKKQPNHTSEIDVTCHGRYQDLYLIGFAK
jgi:hypothetical protein